jgi:hypothetical protein
MRIKNNDKKFIMLCAIIATAILIIYILDLQKYKTDCKALDNIEKIELETRLHELYNKNDQLVHQIENDNVAIKHAQNQINEFKVKCKNCTYHLSTNWEN